MKIIERKHVQHFKHKYICAHAHNRKKFNNIAWGFIVPIWNLALKHTRLRISQGCVHIHSVYRHHVYISLNKILVMKEILLNLTSNPILSPSINPLSAILFVSEYLPVSIVTNIHIYMYIMVKKKCSVR
jgi:hypothetical protein